MVGEGLSRAGAAIANNMVYWVVNETGIAAYSHQSGGSCAPTLVYGPAAASGPTPADAPPSVPSSRALADYVTLDLTMSGTIQDTGGEVSRVPGSMTITGTATSGDGLYEVNVTL